MDFETETYTNEGIVLPMNEERQNETLGSFLKKAREKKSLSLDAISRHTKISSSNLDALEKDNRDALPNIAYVKGFVKSYCKIVDTDLDYCLELLEQLYGQEIHREEKIVPQIVAEATQATKNTPAIELSSDLKVKLLGMVAVVAIGGFIAYNRSSEVPQEVKSEVVKPETLTSKTPLTVTTETNSTAETSVDDPSSDAAVEIESKDTIEEVTEVKADVAPTPSPVKAEVAETKKEVEVAPAPAPEPVKKEKVKAEDKKEIDFYNLPYPLYKISKDADEAKKLIPAGYQILSEGKQNVFITATEGDTWITYKQDSDQVKKFILKQGRYLIIRGNDVRVFLGNANVTKVFLNNNLLDFTTKSGVKSLVFPQELGKKLKLPLFIFKNDGSVITSEEYLQGN
ncbi:DNA-binding helix-turn-helix protein [Bacteriovorax sp. Seq25_V]|nr:DNA-binding helix-turn-helix protein [Bacteriovorax sp. Seq25_V]